MRRNIVVPKESAVPSFHGIRSAAPEMAPLFRLLTRAARTDCTVLVRGETGSGKELVARALHDLSPRARRPFLALNCATLSPTLLESELFGHRRGAFTGAVADHAGVFERAHGGTLLLDEVAEIPLELQARLLRVLEDRTFVPVGGTKPIRADVRLVSATHRALRREVAEGRFRDDLRYRLRVVPVFLPPLRERTGDVDALLFHFIAQFNAQGWRRVEAVSAPALDALRAYPWPGNVRELRNVVEHAFVVGEGPVLQVDDFPPELRGEPPPDATGAGGETMRSAERARLLAALAAHSGRRGAAADALGMSRSTLWRKLREHRLV